MLQAQNQATSIIENDDAVTVGYRTAAVTKGARDGRVSAEWANRPDDEKFLSLDALYESVAERSLNSRSINITPQETRVAVDGENITLDIDGNEVGMTNWAFGQTCRMIGAPADYLRKVPAQLAAINLQHGLMAYQGNQMQSLVNIGNRNMRAVTSPSYGRIYDHEVVEQVMKIAGNGTGDTRWKVPGTIDWSSSENGTVMYNPFVDITKESTTLYASDRDVYLFLVDDTHPIEVGKLPNGEPDLMFRGFIVWNSETGSKSFGMSTMMLRGVCQNRNLWGVEAQSEIRIRHSRNAPDRFAAEAASLLLQYSEAPAAGIITKVRNAKSTIVARDDEERVDFLSRKVGLSKTITERVLETVLKEEQKKAESIWDMVQGMTAVARTYHHQDKRIEMESKAGALMSKI